MFKLPLRKLLFIVKLGFLFVLVLITLSLFEYWRGGKRATRAFVLDPDEELFEKQILEDEARIIHGLGEGGRPAYLTGEDKRLGEEAEKKYAVNTYLSDRIAYNRTLKDFRNPACQRVTYDAELPSTSVIIIFHNEPYSVVIRTIWSVLNTARRDQPWHRQANYLERGTGRVMKLGYPGQAEDSEHVYLKEIILVDDNSTLPELRGKLARYVRTRLPRDMVRVLRLPDRLGLTRARYAGAGAAAGAALVFLDAHCEGDADWLRPLLDRLKHSPKIGLTRARLAGARYAHGEVLIFLDAHCEGVTDWMRPLLQRIKDSPTAVVMPIIDVVEQKDFFYSVQEPSVFQGLMRARVTGARAARGDVLVFLDAHCEAERDWLRPLLQRIRHKRDAVPTPVIDVIDQSTFHLDGEDPIQIGGFTFVGHFTWIDIPEREKRRRGSDIAPTWSPTMAGGLFAIRRAYYWELGAYDEQMAGWGGENLEMSFRIWQCGGTLETIPCSRVGHVFRAFHPYGLPANSDTHGINTARMAEVWMDDFAELFYLHRPDLRKNPIIGDVTHRKILREKLHCKSFQWYLDNVYREKYVPVRDSAAFGRVQNRATGLCLDTMQREGEAAPLGFYPCHSRLSDTQHLSLSLAGQLRDEERCAEVQFVRRAEESADDDVARVVVMVTCRDNTAKMQWRYIAATGQLQHAGTELCLDARRARAGDDARARPCAPDDTPSQRWAFDYMGDLDKSAGAGGDAGAGEGGGGGGGGGVLSPEQEQVLSKIRGQRRKSRSLLSVNEEEPEEGDTRDAGEGDARDTRAAPPSARRHRHRSKKKKKVRKNKFIVTIERTLGNSSVEHLEMDIHCKHRRLYPNNSFVRDLVSILNDRDIRVINNGRVFEKNKVIDLDKERSARPPQGKAHTPEPPPEREGEDESTEASTEKLMPTSQAPPAPPDAEVAPAHAHAPAHAARHDATGKPKAKKRRHKKKHSKPKYEKKTRSHEHSLLLSDHDDDHVALGSGGNGTGALLPTAAAPRPRARETGAEWERDGVPLDARGGRGRVRHRRPLERGAPAPSPAPAPETAPAPDPADAATSAELRLSEDRTRGDFKEVDIPADEGGGDELAAAREEARHAAGAGAEEGAAAGGGDKDRPSPSRGRSRSPTGRARARAEALARHAALRRLKLAGGGAGKRSQVDRAAARDRYVARAAKGDDSGRHKEDGDSSVRRVADRDALHTDRDTDREGHAKDTAHHDGNNINEADLGLDKNIWPDVEVDTGSAWDPWAPRALDAADDARKAGREADADADAGDPHAAVDRLVFGDVWTDATTPGAAADPRVSALAKEVMMEYGELTEEPTFRTKAHETGPGGSGAARGKALRVRLKSNMTFNLGDELLSWRRMQMTGQESESGSPSDEADAVIPTI